MEHTEDLSPHQSTVIDTVNGETVISSVHKRVGSSVLDETCIFLPNGHSVISGTYDDHAAIVASVKRNGSSVTDRFEDRACSWCKRPNVATIGLQVCDCL